MEENNYISEKPFSDEEELFSNYYSLIFNESRNLMDYLIPYQVAKQIRKIARNYYPSNPRLEFHSNSIYLITRILFDNSSELGNMTLQRKLCDAFHEDNAIIDESPVKEILQRLWKNYRENEEDYYGPRDYFKSPHPYKFMQESMPQWLKTDIQRAIHIDR